MSYDGFLGQQVANVGPKLFKALSSEPEVNPLSQ